jgi:hypothetical protein|nr:MAG TPA: hypothetical protein [Caudoviricetes sp.]
MSTKDPYTPEDETRFTLRINTELLERVKAIALREKRSAAKQIEVILENWLDSNYPKE